MIWVPAHTGILGNELADSKAKQVISSEQSENILLPFTDLHALHRRDASAASRLVVTDPESSTGRAFFDRIFRPRAKPWFHGLKLSRRVIVTINRIRANHYNLNSSLARKNLVEGAECDCGAVHQDIDHVMWDCPMLEAHRPGLLRGLRLLGYHPPITVESLVTPPNIASCILILNFLSKSNLKV